MVSFNVTRALFLVERELFVARAEGRNVERLNMIFMYLTSEMESQKELHGDEYTFIRKIDPTIGDEEIEIHGTRGEEPENR